MKQVLILIGLVWSLQAGATTSFIVKDIRLEGLQRISAGTVFNYLPIKVGDKLGPNMTGEAIRSLYKTGFFKDVRLEKEGSVLVIFVAEKPAIASLKIEGNEDIPTDKLQESLKLIGLSEGRVFDRSVLEKIKLELQRQYYSLGKYALKIETTINPLERNRVEIHIKIAEGEEAEVYALNIIGNRKFSTKELLYETSLGEPAMFGGRENYSKQILLSDIESIRTFYMDRGYVNFVVDSTQVSITPDKQDVYVTINITEGDLFTVNDIVFGGDLIVEKEELFKLMKFQSGDVFSRTKLSASRKNILNRLTQDGYAFSNVNITPEVDEKNKTVNLNVFMQTGKRVYVRRVNIDGNNKTKDSVVRREVRQMENGKMSPDLIGQSQQRLHRTGFFEDVSVETPAVPGVDDLVDINYRVKERSTGTLQAGLGYSDQSGTVFTFSVSQENFLGTGTRMSLNLSNSDTIDDYRISYTDPYYTPNGVSRSYEVFSREVDAGEISDTAEYQSNTKGASLGYGMPFSETQFANFSLGFESTELLLSTLTATEQADYDGGNVGAYPYHKFVADYGDDYGLYKLNLGWRYDTRNRAIFASDGMRFGLNTEMATPGSDLEFFKYNINYSQYFEIASNTSILLNIDYGRGKPLGDTRELPFFENYFAGGSRSVRGYKSGTLGPKSQNGDRSLGGVTRIISNLELILPNPFTEKSTSTRTSIFWDMGYAYGKDDPVDSSLLRHSYGVSLIWLTPVGAMRFSYANPYDARENDDTQKFQFTLGSPF